MAKLLTTAELANKIGTTEAGIRTRLARGYLPSNLVLRIGRSVRFNESEIDAWLEQRIADRAKSQHPEGLLTVEQVAELLSTTESGIRGRLSRKSFPADIVVRRDGRVYFHEVLTLKWVEASRKEGAKP